MAALSPCDSTSATTAQTLSALGEERGQTCLHEELTVSRGTRKKQGPAKVPELQGATNSVSDPSLCGADVERAHGHIHAAPRCEEHTDAPADHKQFQLRATFSCFPRYFPYTYKDVLHKDQLCTNFDISCTFSYGEKILQKCTLYIAFR